MLFPSKLRGVFGYPPQAVVDARPGDRARKRLAQLPQGHVRILQPQPRELPQFLVERTDASDASISRMSSIWESAALTVLEMLAVSQLVARLTRLRSSLTILTSISSSDDLGAPR